MEIARHFYKMLRGSLYGCAYLAVILSAVFAAPPSEGLSPDQQRRADQLISLFENSTLEIQYGYCEALHDGRGFTAGRAGFTTSSDEVYELASSYARLKPGNMLEPYLPRLKELSSEGSSSTSGLHGFPGAWEKASSDPAFRKLQDEMVRERFLEPSLALARKLGLKTPLARAALYDTIIQHGNADDPDSLPSLVAKTSSTMHGSPAQGVDERLWLAAFLKIRRACLAHATEPETRHEWAASVDRCEAFQAMVEAGNFDLKGPILVETRHFQATIP